MFNAFVQIEKLRCVDPQDSLTDEVKMQQDGRQVWPNTGDGFFSMSKGNEVEIDNVVLAFADATRITLFDQEDIGSDDNLGSVEIFKNEEGVPRTKEILGPESRYTLFYKVMSSPDGAEQDPLSPVALDGSPGAAYASHRLRVDGIARHFVSTRPLDWHAGKQAGENETVALIGHFHVATRAPAGSRAGITVARDALRRLDPGNGLVGTSTPLENRDYDMALKGLMPIAYRYRHLLRDEDFDFILDKLVPSDIRGGHPPEIERAFSVTPLFSVPETENHLLMIESSRYLVNQLLYDRTPDTTFDNLKNGLSGYLLGFEDDRAARLSRV